ncbi:NAD(+) diphosphatase [Luteimonas panaciterrae]|uniref:NAD(+) diphosphatase n=1 Tax=Luteimonas panaciterrae TaxID=363885 RepID=UPI001CFB50E3|nr:NAD(+) diphosphatase [Luteimonas panaciterrae]
MTQQPNATTYAFVEGALDRAEHLRRDADALVALWSRAQLLAIDEEGRAGADAEGGMLVLRGDDFADIDPARALFLGLQGEDAWFALRAEEIMLELVQRVDLRTAAAAWPAPAATAFAQARALLHWRARHRHCGACGTALDFVSAGWLGRCPQCGLEHYPRTDPAVIVAVSDGERLLLGRQAAWPPRRYSTLAGFVEPGESLEQTVAREVFEESHVRVRSCRYLASQPWPFPSSLMLGFLAEAEPDEPVVDDELEDARWFTFDEIDAAIRASDSRQRGEEVPLLLSPSISISRWLIDRWHAEMRARR